jgi:DNA repair protein RadC
MNSDDAHDIAILGVLNAVPLAKFRTAIQTANRARQLQHPSGDPAPSQEDQEITRRLKETGDMLGIRVLDHVVLGDGRIFSFSDRGLL